MSKVKNLKGKKLNKVSGGGFAITSPICAAAEKFGLDSTQFLDACVKAGFSFERIVKMNWNEIEEVERKFDSINSSPNLTREQINFANSWGANITI